MSDAGATVLVPMTCDRVRDTLRQLDRVIGRVEGRSGLLDVAEFRAYMALRQRRLSLRLLMVARRVELRKQVVSLNRWRYGYQTAESVAPPVDTDATRKLVGGA